MVRVDELRMRLNCRHPAQVFPEFMMRRLILRARLALQQRNAAEAERMWKALYRFGRDSA
jgi:hypothetical protein